MEKLLHSSPSPTPPIFHKRDRLSEVLNDLNRKINAACKIYRSSTIKMQITAFADNSDTPTVINLSELPHELREALHNYATRLIGEKHQLRAKLLIENL